MQHPDVCIAGAGIIGLSLALELTRRGARVTLLDRGPALAEASSAAAGMLAAKDPGNPPLLQPLADLSLRLYPAYLDRIASLSDLRVPFQTDLTLQATDLPSVNSISRSELGIFLPAHNLSHLHLTLLDEHSVDPRQLAPALAAAAGNTGIKLLTDTAVLEVEAAASAITVLTSDTRISATHFVDCTGAWAATCPDAITPRKGQILSVALPDSQPLWLVLRTHDLYIVPRLFGAQAGRAIIGATVEDAGFDKTIHSVDIARLRDRAARLLPAFSNSPILEQWSGLRSVTPDQLPLLGAHPSTPRHLFATGHFRNGVLLAPATAHLLSEIILGDQPSLDLAPFAPGRFIPQSAS